MTYRIAWLGAALLAVELVLLSPTAEAQLDETSEAEPGPEPEAVDASLDAQPELAEEAEPLAEPTPDPSEDIVVTGSRVKSSFGGTAAPVQLVSREELKQAGGANLADIVTNLTSTRGTGALGSTGIGASGGATARINLRGLGIPATLILVNGRRLPQGNDLNGIPVAAVERIEILKAGAAAIYGADAVAGVVNIITRRNLDGLRFEINGRGRDTFDHGEFTGSASFGSVSDRSRVLMAATFFRRTELLANAVGLPADSYVAPNRNSFATYRAVGNPMALNMADPACPPELLVSGPTGSVCTFPYRDYISLVPDVERVNAFASGQYDLNDHVTAFGEIAVTRYRGLNSAVPSFNIQPPLAVVPANHPDNPWGVPVTYDGRPRGAAYGATIVPASQDHMQFVMGLKGDFAAEAGSMFDAWQWELGASFGTVRFRQHNDDTLRREFQAALNGCADADPMTLCFNPFGSALNGTGTANTEAVLRSFTARQVILTDSSLQTYNAGVTGSLFELPGGPLGLAFGGEIRRETFSAQYDHDSQQRNYAFLAGNDNTDLDRDVYGAYLELRWPFLRGLDVQTAIRVEQYTGTSVTPSPFAALVLSPADMAGRENTPSVFQNLQLRANISRAFRAPAITDTDTRVTAGPAALSPSTRPDPLYVTVLTSGNPNLQPETAITFSTGLTWSPFRSLSLLADYWYYDYTDRIQTESATATLARSDLLRAQTGMGLPAVTYGADGGVEAVRVSQTNVAGASVITSGLDFSVTLKIDGADFGGSANDFGQFRVGAEGSYTFSYKLPRSELPAPNPMVQDVVTDQCDGPPAPDPVTGQDFTLCNLTGKRNLTVGAAASLPPLKLNIPVSWSFQGHTVAIIGHYTDSITDDGRITPADMARAAAAGKDPRHVPGWFTFDLQYGYSLRDVIGKEFGVRVGVINAADQSVPILLGGLTPLGEYDYRGRMVYAQLEGEF